MTWPWLSGSDLCSENCNSHSDSRQEKAIYFQKVGLRLFWSWWPLCDWNNLKTTLNQQKQKLLPHAITFTICFTFHCWSSGIFVGRVWDDQQQWWSNPQTGHATSITSCGGVLHLASASFWHAQSWSILCSSSKKAYWRLQRWDTCLKEHLSCLGWHIDHFSIFCLSVCQFICLSILFQCICLHKQVIYTYSLEHFIWRH